MFVQQLFGDQHEQHELHGLDGGKSDELFSAAHGRHGSHERWHVGHGHVIHVFHVHAGAYAQYEHDDQHVDHERNAGPHDRDVVVERHGQSTDVADGFKPGAGDQPRAREAVSPQLHARQTALLVHLPHHHVDPTVAQQNVHAERDLPVHHGPVPVLPPEPAALAKLHPTQPVVQRLFRESAAHARSAGQRKLLDTAPRLGEHVRKRVLSSATEALQMPEKGSATTATAGL